MKDYSAAIRKSFFDALDAQVTYDSTDIPVFDEKVEGVPEKDIWIVIADQVDLDKSNKHQFANETTIDINVISKRRSAGGKKVIDDIADQVLQIILPTVKTVGISIASPFKIVYCEYLNGRSNALQQDSANQFVHIKTLQFRTFITQ
jgi:hypothetical protein